MTIPDTASPPAGAQPDLVAIRQESDIVQVRQRVRARASELRFSLVDQTKLVTAASELARNALVYGGGGRARLEVLTSNGRNGLRVTFEDDGPGMADVNEALRDGFSTGGGLGLGLGGARRLVNEFEIASEVGRGTRIAITRWV
ncbi:MAG TPA: anti-sigma regulatory factor [Gemmatimonadaceae bacterium]|nr:anti-sigma regulatory factor [Gemmatimonadaceae bacterium]